MFCNLLAEMARHFPKITNIEIADCLNVSEKTVKNYLDGTSKISWSNTLKIKNTFFPNFKIEYLFAVDEKQEKDELRCS